jgi:putative ABC transport system permease protein
MWFNNKPPLIPDLILRVLLPKDEFIEKSGDLQEVFQDMVNSQGKIYAGFWYWLQILRAVPHLIFKIIHWRIIMFKTYITHALRLIRKDKFHSFLNILGLSSGIACALIIFLYVQNELTYDSFHKKVDRIYRIYSTYVTSGEPIRFSSASPALGPRLKEHYPQIEEFTRISPMGELLFEYGQSRFYEEDIVYAEPSIFKVFSFKLLQGNPVTALKDPQTIVLTSKVAKKYFGDSNPLGKLIKVENRNQFRITGIIEDLPNNSHLKVRAMISFATWDKDGRSMKWPLFEIFCWTYVLLPQDFDFNSFQSRWPEFYKKHCAFHAKQYGQVFKPIFQKLKNIRYDPTKIRFDVPKGNKSYLVSFFSIGIFILILACINYVNLTTARAAVRAKEIGLKKVLGSERRQLVWQLMGESLFISFMAMVFGFVLVKLVTLLVPVEALLNFEIHLNPMKNMALLWNCIILFLVVGVSAGIYPALHISGVQPAGMLSGIYKSGPKGLLIRRLLVLFQFAVSIMVIIFTFLMNQQITFMQNQDLGFSKENLLAIPVRDKDTESKIRSFKTALLKNTSILSVTNGYARPGSPNSGLYRLETENGMEEHNYHVFFVGMDYLKTLGLELVSGRTFDRGHVSDLTGAVIVNQALVKEMKWKNAIGKRVSQFKFKAQVIGVVKNFNYRSLHNHIEPMIMRLQNDFGGKLIIKISDTHIPDTLAFLKNQWGKLIPNRPFEYRFLDTEFDRQYKDDLRQNSLIRIFSGICILISCLGLLGLSSFNSLRRSREMAIRKVHGASSLRIVSILFKEIGYLLLAAVIVIIPVSIFLIHTWLDNFAYKTSIDIILLILIPVGAVIVAFATASFHSFRVASTNPVNILKHE